jgi:hypothetical protein
MNKINDKGVREGLWCWHTGGQEQGTVTVYYDGIPIINPAFEHAQSSMHGRFSRSTMFSLRDVEIGFIDKNVRNGEYINML